MRELSFDHVAGGFLHHPGFGWNELKVSGLDGNFGQKRAGPEQKEKEDGFHGRRDSGKIGEGLAQFSGEGSIWFDGVFRAGIAVIEDQELLVSFDGDEGLVELAVLAGNAVRLESEVFGQKWIGSLAFGLAVIMFFSRKVGVGEFVGRAVELVDILDVGEADGRDVLGPIVAIGNDELGPGSCESRDFDIVGFVVRSPVNGHAAFTNAAAEKVGRHHADRNGNRDAVVESGEEKTLCAAAGASGDADAIFVGSGKSEHEVDGAHAVPGLQAEDFGSFSMVPARFL